MPFVTTQMNLEITIQSEVNQRQIPCITYMWNRKRIDANEVIYKSETDSQTQKINLWLPKWKGGEEG